MNVSVVLFTSDLRVHDHPPLRAALGRGNEVVPLFVRDPAVARAAHTAPNRDAFLADCLASLDSGLRERGGRLVVRSGDPVAEVCAVVREADADEVHMAAGCSGFARRREDRLRRALEADGRRLYVHDAVVTALPTGAVTPGGSDHYAVFTPYFRRWSRGGGREPAAAPRRGAGPPGGRAPGPPPPPPAPRARPPPPLSPRPGRAGRRAASRSGRRCTGRT
ncbi:deoxyribodipyrimidine photo-lyase, partial [Streptomyces venezuelae]|uniref:deoxyribodipyrimidine photo-lyase n=1 Tax=Streptomyces venezuelae TaxID=54571 RepID=UPI00278C3701